MARLPRLALPEQPHYVIQRGHARGAVFIDDEDRGAYLATLHEAAAAEQVAVQAYALLDQAVHVLLTPPSATALSRTMQALGRRYVGAFNRRHGGRGSLWDGRFRATVLDGATHLLDVMRCIEQAPVRAGLAAQALEWPWSSAAHHAGLRRDALLSDAAPYWDLGNTPFDREAAYRLLLDEALPPAVTDGLVSAALHGWALGPALFVQSLQADVERPLRPRPRGRPLRTGSN
jgi:putative transposase